MIVFFDIYTEPADKVKVKSEKTFEDINKKLQKARRKAKED